MHGTCVVGTGYAGLATVIGLAELGWTVSGFDPDEERSARLAGGSCPYPDATLHAGLRKHLELERVRFTSDLERAVENAELIVIALSASPGATNEASLAELDETIALLGTIDHQARPTVAIRSPVWPGAADAVAGRAEGWADVVVAPAFCRDGSALGDLLDPDRIVVGTASPGMAEPYVRRFERLQKPVVITSRRNAELIKCCSNAFLALKASFADEVAGICAAAGTTADDVLRAIGYDRRIGFAYLSPRGCYADAGLEPDVRTMRSFGEQVHSDRELFTATLRVGAARVRHVVDALVSALVSLRDARIAVWGLTCRAGEDGGTGAFSARVLEELARSCARLTVYDPGVSVIPLPDRAARTATALDAAAGADALLVLTARPEFAALDPQRCARVMRRGFVLDLAGALDPQRVAVAGLHAITLGGRMHAAGTPTQ